MFGVSRQTLERLRKEYPAGTKVELIRLDDPYRKIPSGTIGTVEFVDDAVLKRFFVSGIFLNSSQTCA